MHGPTKLLHVEIVEIMAHMSCTQFLITIILLVFITMDLTHPIGHNRLSAFNCYGV